MKHPYLTTRADSTSFYFRRKIPLRLQPVIQRKDFWLSLETPCKETAITRLPMAALEYERVIAPARAQAALAASAAPPEEAWLPLVAYAVRRDTLPRPLVKGGLRSHRRTS